MNTRARWSYSQIVKDTSSIERQGCKKSDMLTKNHTARIPLWSLT